MERSNALPGFIQQLSRKRSMLGSNGAYCKPTSTIDCSDDVS